MRWTTSPRLTLELALVRAAIPEADPSPGGVAARVERLERLAGIEREVGGVGSAGQPPPNPRSANAASQSAASQSAPSQSEAEPALPHAPSAGSLDVHTIRRSWPQLLERLAERRQMILRANLESVTASAFDGETLELAFPPGKKFAVQKVQSKDDDLRQAFAEVFGTSPRIICVAREAVAGLAEIDEDEPAPSHDDAVARLKEALGAEVEEVAEIPEVAEIGEAP
jgi:DNA polymerase-3 subunit gamma/tau